MKRAIVAAPLVLACGLAAAQGFEFIQDDSVSVQPGVTSSTSRVYIIGTFDWFVAVAQPVTGPEPPLVLNPSQFDEQQSLVGVEGGGVRLPDEQFSLPEP